MHVIEVALESSFQSFPFHPRFLARLAGFSSIRAMDLLATNNNYQQRWSERVTRSNRTYSISGAPMEDVILLANAVGSNVWLNVPHLADDEFVRQMARLVATDLRPDLNVSIELSNEVWGSLFPGG